MWLHMKESEFEWRVRGVKIGSVCVTGYSGRVAV